MKKKISKFEKDIIAKSKEWKEAEKTTMKCREELTKAFKASQEVQATEDVQKVISGLKDATIVVATKTIIDEYGKQEREFKAGGGGKKNNNKTDSQGSKNTPVIQAAFAMGILIIEIMRLHNCTFDQAAEIHLKKKGSKTSMQRYVNFARILAKFNVVGICKWIQCNWSYLLELKCLTSKVSTEYPPPLEVALREFSKSNDVSAFRTEETTSSSSSTSTSSSNGVGDDDDDDRKMSINDDSDDGDDGDDSDEESASKKRKRGEEETSAAKKERKLFLQRKRRKEKKMKKKKKRK